MRQRDLGARRVQRIASRSRTPLRRAGDSGGWSRPKPSEPDRCSSRRLDGSRSLSRPPPHWGGKSARSSPTGRRFVGDEAGLTTRPRKRRGWGVPCRWPLGSATASAGRREWRAAPRSALHWSRRRESVRLRRRPSRSPLPTAPAALSFSSSAEMKPSIGSVHSRPGFRMRPSSRRGRASASSAAPGSSRCQLVALLARGATTGEGHRKCGASSMLLTGVYDIVEARPEPCHQICRRGETSLCRWQSCGAAFDRGTERPAGSYGNADRVAERELLLEKPAALSAIP